MKNMSRLALLTVLATLMSGTALVSANAQNPSGAPPAKSADQAFKNIQVLKGIPADQLIPTMQFISASLGVECEFCHVEGAFDKDDKKPKGYARHMMQMMFAINKDNFDNHQEVTCYSCHRGSPHPVAIPVIPASVEAMKAPEKEFHEEDPGANSPAVIDPILEKYVAAVGGAPALQKVTSRTQKGSVDLSGKQVPIDIYTQAPDKRISIMHVPNGDSITAYNGTVGWLSVPGRPTQWMGTGESDGARLDADLLLPLRIKQIFSDLRLMAPEKIDGRDVNVLQGLRDGKPPVNFYLDQQSGLLVRMIRYIDTPVGRNPVQIDYADYRDSGGVKIPYRWTIARPRGRFTIQLDQVQLNVPIDAQKFAAPTLDQKPPAH